MHFSKLIEILKNMLKGSSTSGNYAHSSMPGRRGGSLPAEGKARPHSEDDRVPQKPSPQEYDRKLRAARSKGLSESQMLLQQCSSYWNGAPDSIQMKMLSAVGVHNEEFLKRPFSELPSALQTKMAFKFFRP